MKTSSIWEATTPASPEFPQLTEDITADVVIAGGGITGITLATLLADAGRNVVVLEAGKTGLGTTGNSTGNLYVTVDEHLSVIRKKWNLETAQAVVAARTAALNFIRDKVKSSRISCDFRETAFHYFAEKLDDHAEDFIREESEVLAELGLVFETGKNPGLPFNTRKFLAVSGQAQFHPLKYVRGLSEKINGNCRIFEDSAVLSFDEEKGTVKTARATVKAELIVMATHTPKGIFAVHTVLGPYREFGVAAALNGASCPEGIFWGINQPKHSIRSFNRGDQHYVMVIGDMFKTGQHGDSVKYINGLRDFLSARFDTGEPTHVWGGQQYRPADGIPYIGKNSEKLFIATGFATDGLIYGTLAAMIISDEILGRKNPFSETFAAGRHTPLKSAKEFFRENADNLLQYLKDTPWSADDDSFRGIQPGEGKIIEKDSEKLAVYKDDRHVLHVVSAVCTHMKCVVCWNGSEKSWDCPCHGSRFSVDGEVIEGPALSNLPKYNAGKK